MCSMQDRSLEQAAAVDRLHADVEGASLAVDGQRHGDPCFAQGPYAAEQAGKVGYAGPGYGQHDVAGAQIGFLRRPSAGEPQDGDAVADLGGIEPEPGPWGPVRPADSDEIIEDRLQQIDGHDHIGVVALVLASGLRTGGCLLYLQGADA